MKRGRVWLFILCAGGTVALTANQFLSGDGRLVAILSGFVIMCLSGAFARS